MENNIETRDVCDYPNCENSPSWRNQNGAMNLCEIHEKEFEYLSDTSNIVELIRFGIKIKKKADERNLFTPIPQRQNP